MATSDMAAGNPFKGLRPYEETDREALFGRDVDFTLMHERLLAGRTTLMFAASGVGKTSFLRARFLPALRKEFKICYHNAWAGQPPLEAVRRSLSNELQGGWREGGTLTESLCEFKRPGAATVDLSASLPLRPKAGRSHDLVLVLDQFEEVFQYFGFRPEFAGFLTELCDLINAHEVGVRVVISMRDDFLGRLSVFDNRIPDLFNNYYRLTSPTKMQAMDIIARTAARSARNVDGPGLRALVDDLATLRRGTVTRRSPGDAEGAPRSRFSRMAARMSRPFVRAYRAIVPRREPDPIVTSVAQDFVVPPFLQIVCHELWETAGDGRPFLIDYTRGPDGAKTASFILDSFCQARLKGLKSDRERDLAASAFDFLMTREGAKMAYQLERLAEHMDVKQPELSSVLNALSDDERRILRKYKGPDGSWWYELYHDMYALILYKWKRAYQARRARGRQAKLAVGSLVLLIVIGMGTDAWRHWSVIDDASEDYPERSYQALKSRLTLGGALPIMGRFADSTLAAYWDRRAAGAELAEERDRALLFRLQALRTRKTAERAAAAAQLANSDDFRVDTTFYVGGEVELAAFSDDERLLVVVSGGSAADIWDVVKGRSVATLSSPGVPFDRQFDPVAQAQVRRMGLAATFFNQGTELLIYRDGFLQRWQVPPAESEWRRTACFQAGGYLQRGPNDFVVAVGAQLERLDEVPADPGCAAGDNNVADAARAARAVGTGQPRSPQRKPKADIAALSGNAKRIITTSQSGDVCVWNAETLRRLNNCPVQGAGSVAADMTSERLAVFRGDFFQDDAGTFQLLTFDGKPVGPAHPIASSFHPDLEFSPAEGVVHVQTDRMRTTFDLASGVAVTQHSVPPQVVSKATSGITVLADYEGGLWLTDAQGRLLTPTFAGQTFAGFSPRGTYLVTGSLDGRVQLWRATSFQPASGDFPSVNGKPAMVSLARGAPCAAHVSGAGQVILRHLVAGTSRPLGSVDAAPTIAALAVSDDCASVAAVSGASNRARTVSIWQANTGAVASASIQPALLDPTVEFSREGTRLLVSSGNNPTIIRASSPITGQEPAGAAEGFVLLDVKGRELARGTGDRGLSRQLTPRAQFSEDSSRVIFVNSPGTAIYATVDGARIPVADPVEGAPLATHADLLGFTDARGTIIVRTGPSPVTTRLTGSQSAQSMSFSADGAFVATVEQQALKVYKVADGSALRVESTRRFSAVRFHPHPQRPAIAVAVAPEGIQLFQVNADGARSRGENIVIGTRGTTADDIAMVALEFGAGSDTLVVATRQCLHRLAIGNAGLRPTASRFLPGQLYQQKSVQLLDDGRAVAVVEIGTIARRIAVVDFDEQPAAPPGDLASWTRKLGMLINQGAITTSRNEP